MISDMCSIRVSLVSSTVCSIVYCYITWQVVVLYRPSDFQLPRTSRQHVQIPRDPAFALVRDFEPHLQSCIRADCLSCGVPLPKSASPPGEKDVMGMMSTSPIRRGWSRLRRRCHVTPYRASRNLNVSSSLRSLRRTASVQEGAYAVTASVNLDVSYTPQSPLKVPKPGTRETLTIQAQSTPSPA